MTPEMNTDALIKKHAKEFYKIIHVSNQDKDLKKMLEQETQSLEVVRHFSKNGNTVDEARKVEPIILQRIQLLATLAYNRKQDRTNYILIILTALVAILTLILVI